MLRTAEEILKSFPVDKYEVEISLEHAIYAINEARRECIDECAKLPKLSKVNPYEHIDENGCETLREYVIDVYPILKLKEQIK